MPFYLILLALIGALYFLRLLFKAESNLEVATNIMWGLLCLAIVFEFGKFYIR